MTRTHYIVFLTKASTLCSIFDNFLFLIEIPSVGYGTIYRWQRIVVFLEIVVIMSNLPDKQNKAGEPYFLV